MNDSTPPGVEEETGLSSVISSLATPASLEVSGEKPPDPISVLKLDSWKRVNGLTRWLEGTPKQKRAALYRAAGYSQKKSEELAGYASNANGLWNTEQQVKNVATARESLIKYLDAHGASLDETARVIGEGLRAERETKLGTAPDWGVRHKFTDTVLKVQGAYAPTKVDIREAKMSKIQVQFLKEVEGELD
jgi:hypothetical protein